MPRLPIPSQDQSQWGDILNEFLRVAHNDNGTQKDVMNVVNVKDYGAVGDGNTNDTWAIQEAVTSVDTSDANSGIIFFPTGIYRCDGITLPADADFTFLGTGPYTSVLKQSYSQSASFIRNTTGSVMNFSMFNLAIDGNGGSATNWTVACVDLRVHDATIQNCRFIHSRHAAIKIQEVTGKLNISNNFTFW